LTREKAEDKEKKVIPLDEKKETKVIAFSLARSQQEKEEASPSPPSMKEKKYSLMKCPPSNINRIFLLSLFPSCPPISTLLQNPTLESREKGGPYSIIHLVLS
jgi:hypothetical protein